MKIYTVDAFTDKPYSGNPAGVCVLESPKTERWMQNIAAELNLSETAFLTRQNDGFSLRWFSPEQEVSLCGHATLASAHLLWEAGIAAEDEIRFNTKSGLLSARRNGSWIELNFPLEPPGPAEMPGFLTDSLGAAVTYVGRNRMDYLVEVENPETVESLDPDFGLMKKIGTRGVIVTAQTDEPGIDFVSRCFFPALGIDEDPVTGSAHCCLGPYWSAKLGKKELSAKQLSQRGGFLKLKLLDRRILIYGQAVTVVKSVLCAGE